ncbi:MAG: long-chain fatty acid--CoA ligase [Acidobacteria bacterium]|nr:long-chain fatty acid--CoA ligase [Acidobacteriota bacterium]
MQLIDLFNLSLIGRSDVTALEYEKPGGGYLSLTFGELDTRSNRVAGLLHSKGLVSGDRLAIFLVNRVEFIDLLLACLKMGVIVVPINVLYRHREIAHIVTDAAPRLVVATLEQRSLLPEGIGFLNVDEVQAAATAQVRAENVRLPLDGDTPAAIVYTSGTTGQSKGAVLTHNNFASNALNLLTCWRISREDRFLAVLPLFHVHGLGNGVMTWLIGGTLMRLVERFDIRHTPAVFDEFQPTLFFGVPTIYVRMLELPESISNRVGQRMRLFVCGSAPLPGPVLTSFEEKFGHRILERYGMSETLMNISNPYEGERREGSVGLPLPGVSVRVVDDQGFDLPAGSVGELLVRGPNVFAGYWRRPEATEAAFVAGPAPQGWFRTGDLAERSDDGYYTLRGRRTDLIISGGFNIYPREIEELLLEYPGVREAVVCGQPDERRGEVPVAYLVSDNPLDVSALEDLCKRSLASFKLPRSFVRVDSLPRNAMGKVMKHLLPGSNS